MEMDEIPMKRKTWLLGALAYLLVTFPLAFVWHLVIFKDTYQWLGMYREDPSVPLGFLVILLQGLLLSYAFPLFYRNGSSLKQGLKFGLFMGAFLWSSQVVAAAAKHEVASVSTWLAIESTYFLVQFTLVGLALGLVYARRDSPVLATT